MLKGAPTTPKNWRTLARHELSAAYEDIAGDDWDSYLAGLREHGILNGRKVTLFEGKVLDGWQLQRGCVALGIKPKYQELPEGITAERYVELVNDVRRHETMVVRRQRAEARRQRVAQARAEGKSTRAIAEQENISQTQVREDLKAATEQGCSVDPPEGKVTGKDGKTRTATPAKPKAPMCPRCTRIGSPVKGCPQCKEAREEAKPKQPREPGDDTDAERWARDNTRRNGKVVFDWKKIEAPFGQFVRAVDEAGKALGRHDEYKALDKLTEQVAREFISWKQRITGGK